MMESEQIEQLTEHFRVITKLGRTLRRPNADVPPCLKAHGIVLPSIRSSKDYSVGLEVRLLAFQVSTQISVDGHDSPSYFGCSLFFQWSLMLLATPIRYSLDTLSCMLSITLLTVLM